MSDHSELTRRTILSALGGLGAVGAASGFSEDTNKELTGGTMALQEAYNVAGKLWIGPDSARSEVAAQDGRVYIGASGDGYTFYNGDGGSWDRKGLGDSANPLPSVNTDEGRADHNLSGSNPLKEFTDDGIWTWHQNPRAVSGNGKTFTGWINQNGDVVIGSYDHSNGTSQTNTLKSALDADDHAAPGLAISPSGTIWAFYAAHDGADVFYRESSSAYDISSFGTEGSVSPGTTHEYANPRFDGNGRLWLIVQDDNNNWVQMYTDDGGSSWSSPTSFLTDTQGTFIQMGDSGDGPWHFAAYRNGPDYSRQDIYHGIFDGGTIRKSDGTSLGSSTDITNLTLVYDSAASGLPAQAFDCTAVDGTPQITFGVYPDEDRRHEYRYATREGGSWSDHRLVSGGSSIVRVRRKWNYSGLAHLDRREYGVAYASVGDHNSSKIVRLETEDDGASWYSEDVSGSAEQNIRPISPPNYHEDAPVLWLKGQYNDFSGGYYDTRVVFGRETADGADNVGGPGTFTHIRHTAGQSISSDTSAVVDWDDVVEDETGEFDLANNEFVADSYGLYHFEATATFEATSGINDGRAIGLMDDPNPGGRIDADYTHITAGEEISVKMSGTSVMTPGDSVQVQVRQESGSAVNLATGKHQTHFIATQLR